MIQCFQRDLLKIGGRNMISKKLAIDVLNASLATGADYSEIFYEDSHAHSVVIENGKVETSSSNSMCGVGLRLLKIINACMDILMI